MERAEARAESRALRIGQSLAMVPARHGRFLVNINDRYVGRSLLELGQYCEDEVALFGAILRPGNVVVEVGANIGALTVPLARIVGRDGLVLAFEPQKEVARLLSANIALNELGNVSEYVMGCGADNTTMVVPPIDYTKPNNFGGVSLMTEGEGYRVPVVKLDDTVGGGVTLLKVDCEGMEAEVLRGAVGLIERFRPAIYVENDRADKATELIQLLWSFGYKLWWHETPLWAERNFFNCASNPFGAETCVNMIGFHADEAPSMQLRPVDKAEPHPIAIKRAA